jgi:hypothetical protein
MELTMTAKMQRIGTIRPLGIEPYLSYLRSRLRDETKGHVRKYIRSKIKRLGKAAQGSSTPKSKNPLLTRSAI